MANSPFQKYLAKASVYWISNRHCMRQGQAYMNALHSFSPRVAKQIAGTNYDPFYTDSNLSVFFEKVKELLNASLDG